ncbi:MAG: hypothetical protein ABI168_00290 [Ginsengibacter sp.]
MTKIDKKYNRQILKNVEMDLPYINLSLMDNLYIIKTGVFICLFLSAIVAFLPPRFGANKFTLPNSWNDYFERLKYVLIMSVIIIVFVLVWLVILNFRTFIDRRFGYTNVGVFKVTKVWNLWVTKIVVLNNFHFLTLRKKDFGFDDIEVKQVVQIERTATHKFMSFQIKQ